jgi:hypothetical protein
MPDRGAEDRHEQAHADHEQDALAPVRADQVVKGDVVG